MEYGDENQQFHTVRFGQQFAGRAANPEDLLLLKRERAETDTKDVKNAPAMTEAVPRVSGGIWADRSWWDVGSDLG